MAKRVKTIEELKRELADREAQIAPLQAKRDKLAKQLADLDEEIAALTGTPAPRRGRKPGRKKGGRKAIVRVQGKRGRRGKRKGAVAASTTTASEEGVPRFTGKGVRSLRKKLKLSQESFGKLVGVSPQTVYQWEGKPGQLTLRKATQGKLAKAWTTDSGKAQMPAEETQQEKKPVKKTAKKKTQKKEQPQE